jgi:hypothetical protein
MSVRQLAALLCVAPLFAACASNERSSWGGTMSDSAGVTVVANPAEGVWTPESAWKVEEVLSIGSVEGDEAYQFGTIAGVDVDAEGHVYIADQQAQNVREFDASGHYVRTLGGPGSGPGEMGRGVTGVFVVGDEILVPDLGNQRIDRFGVDGTSLGSDRVDLTQGLPVRWDAFSDGRLVVQKRAINLGDSTVAPRGDPIVTLAAEGEQPDTVAVLPVGQSFQFTGGRPRIRMFKPEPVWDASPDGRLLTAINDGWHLQVWSPDGSLARIITRPSERKPVTERDKQVIRDAIRDLARQQGVQPQAIDALMQQYEFADTYPAFYSLALGPDGSVWVQQLRSGDDLAGEGGAFDIQDLGSTDWGVFDAEGRYLGVVTFPGRYQPIRSLGDRFYGVARDELDVQSLKVYRVITG